MNKFWTHLVANVWLETVIYDGDGTPEPDGWTLHDGKNGPEIAGGAELDRWIDREFEEHGCEAFNLRALYEMQREEEGDHAA